MKKLILALAASASLSACVANPNAPVTQGQAGTVAITGAIGALAGQVLGGDTESTLTGLAVCLGAGTLIATQQGTRQCYYADGRGGYYQDRCV